jgi:hypothetical protein
MKTVVLLCGSFQQHAAASCACSAWSGSLSVARLKLQELRPMYGFEAQNAETGLMPMNCCGCRKTFSSERVSDAAHRTLPGRIRIFAASSRNFVMPIGLEERFPPRCEGRKI